MPKIFRGNTTLKFGTLLAQILCACGFIQSAFALSHTQLQLQIQQNQYLGPSIDTAQSDRLSTVGVHYSTYGSWRDVQAGMNVQGLWSVNGQSYEYIAVPELYSTYTPDSNWQVTIGRQVRDWSEFDSEWRLGIWQPVARWDYLDPQTQGLTGFFVDLKQRQAGATIFVSPFFLPDQGPDFEVVDGSFSSDNRWFWAPQTQASEFGESTAIEYMIDKPTIKEVVFRPSWGAKTWLGDKSNGAWVQLAYADKPVNQMQLAVEGFKNLSLDYNSHAILTTIHPYIVRHKLATLESGYSNRDLKFWASVSHESFTDPELPDEWERGMLNESIYGGLALSHGVELSFLPPTWLKWMYMKTWELEQRTGEGLIGASMESSMARIPYSEVAGFEWTSKVWETFQKRLLLGMRYLYSVPDEGSILQAKVQWVTSRSLRWDLGLDVLGSRNDESSSSLVGRYRSNDRINVGVTYVF